MSKLNCLFVLAVFILLSSVTVFADQITLKSGDRLTGKIIKQDDEKIILQTEFAGIITISKSTIEKISIDKISTETLAENTVEPSKVETVKAESEVGKVKVINAVYEKEATDTTPKMPVIPNKRRSLGFTEGWDGAANIGFSLTRGNSDTTTLTAGIRAVKASESSKWTTYLNSLWNRNRVGGINLTTSNATWGGVRYDRNITKKVFAFGSYDFERDQPQLLNFRSVVGGGLGYHAIKNDRTELDFFGGAAWNRTWYIGPNRSSAEILVGNTLKHKFNDRVKFQQCFTFYPNLTDTGEYRFIFDSTLSADVTKRIGWFVTVGNRFNSLPIAGVDKNDFLFATGLKWAFGKTK